MVVGGSAAQQHNMFCERNDTQETIAERKFHLSILKKVVGSSRERERKSKTIAKIGTFLNDNLIRNTTSNYTAYSARKR